MARPLSLRRRVEVGKPGVPEDVAAVEAAMAAVGYYEPPVFGTGRSAPQELDNAIRQLQTDRGLKPDGAIEPNGPAAEHINALLTGRRRRPDNPSADTLLAELRREQAEKRARGAGAPATGRPPWAAPSFLEPGAPTLLGNAMRALAQKLARGAEAPPVARRAIPDNPSADTLLAELRRDQAEKRARETGTPQAGQPPSGAPSFTGSGAGTLLGNAMRALAGGAETPETGNRPGTPPVARRVLPDNPSADTLLAELRREQAEKRTGLGDTPPPGRTRSGDMEGMFERMVPPTADDVPRAEFERRARMTPEERQREFVESADRQFHRFAREWRKDGYKWAPAFMENYLKGNGYTFELTRDQARELAPIRDAEAKNRRRVERSFVERMSPSGEPNPFYKAILAMIDGKTDVMATTKDRWQVAYEEGSLLRNSYFGNPDFGRAFGQLAVNAFVTAEAAFKDGKIVVSGSIDHWLMDRYDFGGDEYGYSYSYGYERQAAALEEAGRARQFDVGAGWKQRFIATIEIADGKPRIEKFEWVDTEELVDWRHSKIVADEDRKARQTAP